MPEEPEARGGRGHGRGGLLEGLRALRSGLRGRRCGLSGALAGELQSSMGAGRDGRPRRAEALLPDSAEGFSGRGGSRCGRAARFKWRAALFGLGLRDDWLRVRESYFPYLRVPGTRLARRPPARLRTLRRPPDASRREKWITAFRRGVAVSKDAAAVERSPH